LGEYFTTKEPLTTPALVRNDANINFNWSMAAPFAGLPADGFSVRWTGQITPRYSQTYTFIISADDGFRLWVDGVPVIDHWVVGATTEFAGNPIALTAGHKYDLKLEYYENTGYASAKLLWSSASQAEEVVPASVLSPPVAVPGALWGDYFLYETMTGYYAHRDDGPVSFDWSNTGPVGVFNFDTDYSVRWTGSVLPPVTGTYTFYTTSDDGVRLWVDGKTLIDHWNGHSPLEDMGTISLTAGQRVNLRLDYEQLTGGAVISLSWAAPGVPKALVPGTAMAR
jgi:hypothetical protein